MTRQLDRIERQSAEQALRQILRGARLDSFHVRSVELTLSFVNEPSDDRPAYVWLRTGAPAMVGGELTEWPAPPTDDAAFHAGRAEMLPLLYRLVGDSVAEIAIAPDGALSASFTGQTIVLVPRHREAEEVWTLSDQTPDTFDAQGWRITLSNGGRLTVKRPER